MRSLLTLAMLTLLMGAALPAPTHALAAEPGLSCQNQPATIVDLDGGEVQGTAGHDVILAAGESTIWAGGGDDTICFQDGLVDGGEGRDSVRVAGDVVAEDLRIWNAEDLDVTIGAGGGRVELLDPRTGTGTVDVRGGAALTLIGKHKVLVDLKDDSMRLDRASYTVLGNPGIFAIARRVELVGDAAPNSLSVNQYACRITMKGGRGRDRLTVAGSDGELPFPENCGSWPSQVYGHRGNDLLQGRGGRDILVGGPGKDVARGGRGIDTCRAERERNCER